MSDDVAAFGWYELMTTDIAAAHSFYASVVGWRVEDAATPRFDYRLFAVEGTAVAGLMELPIEGRRRGATPRWAGYVAVRHVDRVVERLRQNGGAVYLPPTDSNIGRVAVVADPQGASFALVGGLSYGEPGFADTAGLGRIAWHELLAGEANAAFRFYHALFGWETAEVEGDVVDSYRIFAAGDRVLGGIFTKFAATPVPFWLFYFTVADLDLAIDQVRAGGGRVAQGPIALWGGKWAARCIDPQGAMFALLGERDPRAIGRGEVRHSDAALAWSASWGGISSRGRLLGKEQSKKPRDGS